MKALLESQMKPLENNAVFFYPNPFTSETKIQIKSPTTEPIQLKIVDMKGIVCFSSNEFYTNQNITIDNSFSYWNLHSNCHLWNYGENIQSD